MKKILSVILSLHVLINGNWSLVVSADNTDGAILNKINSLYDLLGNTYFNVNHIYTDCGSKSSGHGCENCLTSNIVNASWF